MRGDCNDDAGLDIADGAFLLNHLYDAPETRSPAPTCAAACDANGDGALDQSDAIYIFNYQFLAGPPPAEPFPECSTADPSLGLCLDQESCR